MHHLKKKKDQYLKIKAVALVKCLDIVERKDFYFLDLLALGMHFRSVSL